MSRVRYSSEVREHALSLVLTSHLPVSHAAREAGCSVNSLHYWLKKHRREQEHSTGVPDKPVFVPVNDHLFVFLNRHHTLMKILYWDGDGFVIWYKRLEGGTFRFPANINNAKSIEVTRSGLALILEGIDLSPLPRRKRFSQKSA